MADRKLSPEEDRALKRAVRSAKAYREAFANLPPGTSARDLEVLLVLARDKQATAADLARALSRDRPAMSRALERLRRRQLVRLHGTEGRRRLHELTDQGWGRVRASLRPDS